MNLLRVVFLVVVLIYAPSAIAQEWKSVKGTKLCGISGLAMISQNGKQTQYLAVHDNKQLGEPRLAIITDEVGAARDMNPSFGLTAIRPLMLKRSVRFLALITHLL